VPSARLYVSNGFIDFASIPNTQNSSDATVDLSIGVMEGTQYRAGKLEIFTKKEIAEKLRTEWELPEGAVFDLSYLDKYIDRNRSLLPSRFQRSHAQIVRDCPNATVEIRLSLDAMDPRSQSLPKNSPCGSPDNSPR
jgi:outer membrane protein assembly factor BamA